jgi:large subunit ribosomal protein L6
MSRIGKQPIPIPEGVKVELSGNTVNVEGPKGKLSWEFSQNMIVEASGNQVLVKRPSETKLHKSIHGLTRTLIANMVAGVVSEFEKVLELKGVGYKANLSGKSLTLQLGYSHPLTYTPPGSIKLEVEKNTIIKVKGPDKQMVGEVAAEIRALRKPEPYKGKGIRYAGEVVRHKVGKAIGATTT